MEKFKCSCGFEITVDWNVGETEKDIPCGICYYEEYYHDDVTKITTKTVHGNKIHCVKGTGI